MQAYYFLKYPISGQKKSPIKDCKRACLTAIQKRILNVVYPIQNVYDTFMIRL